MTRHISVAVPEDARARLLRAAEQLFARVGVENAALRELTAMASVNLASVNYYFGSKNALVEAVFDSLSARVNSGRLAALAQVLDKARKARRRPAARDILMTFVRPYFDDVDGEGSLLAQLVLKHRMAPSEMTNRIIDKHFDPMARQYVEAFELACPAVPREELYWRYMFMAGAVCLTATDRNKVNRVANISRGSVDASNATELVEALLRFLVGGLSVR